MINFTKKLNLIESWLIDSGIHNTSNESHSHGGMHAWFDNNSRDFSFLYTEITGYALTWFIYQYESTQENKYLDHANDAAKWICNEAFGDDTGGVLCRHDGVDWKPLVCAFDNGMCLNGICNIYKHIKDDKFLKTATGIGNWLLGSMQQSDGSFYSKYNPNTHKAFNPEGKWSLMSGCFLIKLSIGLINLTSITGDQKYSSAAKLLCDWGLNFQESNGRFRTSPNPDETFLHPHCYAAEGLIVAGIMLKNSSYIEASKKAINWIQINQMTDGSFPSHFYNSSFGQDTSPDMTAQVLRIWMMLPEKDRPSINLDAAIKSILKLQCLDIEQQKNGGIASGAAWFTGEKQNFEGEHINSWVSMFSAQALRMSKNHLLNPLLLV